jgi:radical SAM protein with 4Fe4S-binding SPASM domain
MKQLFIDKEYNFYEIFNTKTGFYVRSGEIVDGKDTGVDPFLRSFPSLIDIGVMGHCIHGAKGLCKQSGVQCYQSGFTKSQPNMSLEDFKTIIDESKGKVFQVALGGRGDVNKHENFEELLSYCRENNIVPNFTTSGLDLTEQEVEITKKYCGAVAVSWYRQQHTIRAINMFLAAGVKTNIHYVLGSFSIEEAIYQLRVSGDSLTELGYPLEYVIDNKLFPEGINAVIFLAHKPVGQGDEQSVLLPSTPGVEDFFTLVDKGNTPFKIGFDSCTICGVVNYTKSVNMDTCDFCEGARYSMYISADMVALPCSFDQAERWGIPLYHNIGEGFSYTIKEAWDSYKFENFRSHFKNSCPECPERMLCMGGCPIIPQVSLCDREEKDQKRDHLHDDTLEEILSEWRAAL